MQVIENMEKGLQRLLTADFLEIVDDEHINALVEVDKTVDGGGISIIAVGHCRVSILHLEIACRHKEHPSLWKLRAHSIAHSIHQVGFAHARWSIKKEGIESLRVGIFRHGARHIHGCTIADALTITVEGVSFNEMRLKMSGFCHRRQLRYGLRNRWIRRLPREHRHLS